METKLIYKYRHFDSCGYHLKLVSHGELYFASPSQFNDPFDCALPLRLDLLGFDDALPLYAEEVRRRLPEASEEEARQIAADVLSKGDEWSLTEMQALTEVGRERMNALFRVLSLSANPGHILMWSHYSDQHRGFCVGFDWDKLAEALGAGSRVGGFYVRYEGDMPALSPSEFEAREIVERSLETKYSCWSYEEEYRFFSSAEVPPLHVLPPGVVVEVTMGCEIDPKNRELLISALRARGDKGVRLYKATKQIEQFALTRHEVEYWPAT